MKWSGNKIEYEIYGESHSEEIGIKICGLPDFCIDRGLLDSFMARRKAVKSAYSTSRIEPDEIIFVKGIENCKISGDLEAKILNTNVKSGDYSQILGKPRPSHADYASFAKFGRTDFSGGREFSARMTAPLCILGGIAKQILFSKGIEVFAYVQQVGKVCGKSYKEGKITQEDISEMIQKGDFALSKQEDMLEYIKTAKENKNSVGGAVECVVFGMPAGVGYTMAEGLESAISMQVFSVPAVKGIEFGAGFDLVKMYGNESNDEFYYENGTVKTKTNNAGGINGGISNGNPITMRIAMRPTPSIGIKQWTVDLINKVDTAIEIKGRHDACIAIRALPVIESAVAIAILDNIL